jgi:hypothetical protein
MPVMNEDSGYQTGKKMEKINFKKKTEDKLDLPSLDRAQHSQSNVSFQSRDFARTALYSYPQWSVTCD